MPFENFGSYEVASCKYVQLQRLCYIAGNLLTRYMVSGRKVGLPVKNAEVLNPFAALFAGYFRRGK